MVNCFLNMSNAKGFKNENGQYNINFITQERMRILDKQLFLYEGIPYQFIRGEELDGYLFLELLNLNTDEIVVIDEDNFRMGQKCVEDYDCRINMLKEEISDIEEERRKLKEILDKYL